MKIISLKIKVNVLKIMINVENIELNIYEEIKIYSKRNDWRNFLDINVIIIIDIDLNNIILLYVLNIWNSSYFFSKRCFYKWMLN